MSPEAARGATFHCRIATAAMQRRRPMEADRSWRPHLATTMNTATRISFILGLALSAGALQAQDHHAPPPSRPHGPPPGLRLDDRYHHDHYYPPRGYASPRLPGGSVTINYRGGNYFFHGGVWFRPYGGRFVVIAPPFGIVVPVLPPAFVTLWIGGAPYYYANGVYYAQAPGEGYAVVEPPPGADSAQPAPAPKPMPDPIIYPRNGQSEAQTEADRQECNRWATTQPSAVADASVFQRAVAACMDGRGYTVR